MNDNQYSPKTLARAQRHQLSLPLANKLFWVLVVLAFVFSLNFSFDYATGWLLLFENPFRFRAFIFIAQHTIYGALIFIAARCLAYLIFMVLDFKRS